MLQINQQVNLFLQSLIRTALSYYYHFLMCLQTLKHYSRLIIDVCFLQPWVAFFNTFIFYGQTSRKKMTQVFQILPCGLLQEELTMTILPFPLLFGKAYW